MVVFWPIPALTPLTNKHTVPEFCLICGASISELLIMSNKENEEVTDQSHDIVTGTWSFQAKNDPSEISVHKSTQSRKACNRDLYR
jgi:hypothetical protein